MPLRNSAKRDSNEPEVKANPACPRCQGRGWHYEDRTNTRPVHCVAPGCWLESHTAWCEWRERQKKQEEAAEVKRLIAIGICPTCRGLGLVHPLKQDGRTDYSKVQRCRCRRGYVEARLSRPPLQVAKETKPVEHVAAERASRYTFEEYRAAPGTMPLYTSCRQWCEKVQVPWLYIEAPPGTGKTHLMQAIANYHRRQYDVDVHYISVPDLTEQLYGGTMEQQAKVMESMKECALLIIDQFGQSWGKGETSRLETLLDFRYEVKLLTVIGSDRPLAQCPSERIRSRILDSARCQIVMARCNDYRTYSEQQRKEFPFASQSEMDVKEVKS